MMRINKIPILIASVLLAGFTSMQKNITAAQLPNIVFILADDCTHWDIGCYGSKDSKTPKPKT